MTSTDRTDPPTVEIIDGPHYTRDDQGEHHAYTLRLAFAGRTMDTPWRQGLGITDDPSIGSVMSALLSDASGVEATRDFAEWAGEYGYSDDSIKARDLYTAVMAQTDALSELLTRRVMVSLMEDEDATYGNDARFGAAWERAAAVAR